MNEALFKIGEKVVLKPKSKHGKDRVAQHGSVWRIKQIGGNRHNSMLLESLNMTFNIADQKSHDLRWVKTDKTDPDFTIIRKITDQSTQNSLRNK